MKPCPSCGAENHGKAAECKKCRHAFPYPIGQPAKPKPAGDSVGVLALVVFAVLFGLGGLVFASQATSGVAAITFGCLLAIFARIAQAGRQHEELMNACRPTSRTAVTPRHT